MFDSLKDLFRRHSLRKNASTVPTGIVPMAQVHSAAVFIDVEDPDFDACKRDIQAFFRRYGIKGDIFFFDFRKLTSGERLITSITTTVLRKDLNWYDRPSREKVKLLLDGQPDMFISLLPGTPFPLTFMATASQARFKVGREQLPVFDLVVKDPAGKALSQREALQAIIVYLDKIQ